MNKINTLDKFLDKTKYNRDTNYPSVETLKLKMKELRIKKELSYDIMAYFLYYII